MVQEPLAAQGDQRLLYCLLDLELLEQEQRAAALQLHYSVEYHCKHIKLWASLAYPAQDEAYE